jgi:hypothetical protein
MVRCEDVWNPEADPEQVALHLDTCEACDRELRARTGAAVNALPVEKGPSMAEVRKRIRFDRQSLFMRFAGAAAAAVFVIVTGWALGRSEAPRTTAVRKVVEETIPDPPALETLPDAAYIKSEGVVSHYLQFALSCLNTPTEEDKREYLIRALLVLRETRSSMKARFQKGGQTMEAVTRESLDEALQTMRSSPLTSVKLLPSKINTFALVGQDQWRVDHVLGSKQWRLTLHPQPLYLHFAYMKAALQADDAQMSRIEDTLWFSVYVDLPKRVEDKDPKIPTETLNAVLPLLSARQQKIFRKIVGVP